MRVTVHTLGCRVNHYESELIRERLQDLPWEGEIHVVNTCTVTSLAARKSRKLIRRLRREHPGALIVAVGCRGADDPGELEAAGADLVLGNKEKAVIREAILAFLEGKGLPDGRWPPLSAERISRDPSHVRAILKVQDGCTRACTFCKTWQVRGPLRSKPPAAAREEAELLAEAGHPEVVVTGINLAQYGEDLPERPTLVELLRELLRVEGIRIRLSSLNPEGVTPELIDLFADESRLCPYFHLPLQSGDDRLLERMGRPYTASLYLEVVEAIKARVPRATVGADVMVGFPGEDDVAFERTCELLERVEPLRLHIFRFSPRPGTPAASFPGRVPEVVKKSREEVLRQLGAELSLRARRGFLGEVLHPVLEEKEGELWLGHAENFILMGVSAPDGERGKITPARLTEVGKEISLGVIEDQGVRR